jgi:phosphate acetyltransferase
MSDRAVQQSTHSKYERLISAARSDKPAVTVVAHPCDETSLRGALEAAAEMLIMPVLVGPEAQIRAIAGNTGSTFLATRLSMRRIATLPPPRP